MSQYDFDLLTIGGGSGGVRASRWAGQLGARVAICEQSRYGGTCVIRGCIPKKLMWSGSELNSHLKYFSHYGWQVGKAHLDWLEQKSLRDKELNRLEGIYENLLSKTGVKVLKGQGQILSPHTVKVEGKTYTARYILIAVGGEPYVLNFPGHEWTITSDNVFDLKTCPPSILIMGSGYIGVEFASIFNNFGSKVHLVYRKDLPLRGFDQDLRIFLQKQLQKSGVELVPKHTIHKIVKKGKKLEVFLHSLQDKVKKITVDKVLLATGRRPKLKGLGLEALDLKINPQGEIKVDQYFETSVKGIYALGDCANTPYQLTPVATAEGMLLAENLFAKKGETQLAHKKIMDYSNIPTAVFSSPPLATVGLTEQEAIKKGHKVLVYMSQFRPLKYTVTPLDKKTFMKLIVDKKTDKVLGAMMGGDDAPEIMQGVAVALKMGALKSDLDKTLGIHPTSAEEWVTMRQAR